MTGVGIIFNQQNNSYEIKFMNRVLHITLKESRCKTKKKILRKSTKNISFAKTEIIHIFIFYFGFNLKR